MKKIITFLYILFTMPIFAQWIQQDFDSIQILNDIYCINQDVAYAVGNNGTILKTNNGGLSWIEKISDPDFDIIKVQFIDYNVGFAIGVDYGDQNGILVKTIDGGETWNTISLLQSQTSNVTTKLVCINENVLYISFGGVLKKSIDGGLSFTLLNDLNSFSIFNFNFINEEIGFCKNDYFYKTIDGGNTWSTINTNNVFSFSFLNGNNGFFYDSTGFYKTENSCVTNNYLGNSQSGRTSLFATTENIFWGIPIDCLLDGSPCFSIRGEIVDANSFQITTGPPFKAIHFSNPTNGYAIGIGSEIYKNTTGTMLRQNEVSKKQNFTIYPNPATSQITVSLTELPTQSFEIEITNMLGKKVYSQSYQPINNVSIDTKAFSKGVYFLTAIQQDKKETQKVIID